MKTLALFVTALLAVAGVAHADTPFDVLAKPNATWTYDVLSPKKHKPTGKQVTVKVNGVKTVGPYTVVELATTPDDGGLMLSWIMIGPDGVRGSQFTLNENYDTKAVDYSEEMIGQQYKQSFLPLVYLPGTLKKGAKKLNLDRFGEDDRVYKVTATLSKAKGKDATGWHLAWKGTYTVPEDPSGSRQRYTASLDFDPAIGLTQICVEDDTCFKLAP